MLSVEYSETFAFPAASVFAALADLPDRQVWQPDIIELRVEPAEPTQVGSQIFEIRKVSGFKSESTLVVSVYEQDRRLKIETAGDAQQRNSESYQIEPLADGTCRLHVTNEIDGVPRVGEFFVRQTLKKLLPQYFERLKAVIVSRG